MVAHGIDLKSELIRAFCRKWQIAELGVFGSILRSDFRSDSDIDFLVTYEDSAKWDLFDAMHMQEELALILGRSIDLVDRYAIENDGNRFIRDAVLSSAESIYVNR